MQLYCHICPSPKQTAWRSEMKSEWQLTKMKDKQSDTSLAFILKKDTMKKIKNNIVAYTRKYHQKQISKTYSTTGYLPQLVVLHE